MPPKKLKLHELAVEVAQGTTFSDLSKKTQYVMGKQFATGGFGRIYTCKEQGQTKELVVKVEPNTNGPLFTEIHVFQRILKKEMLTSYAKQMNLTSVGLPWVISSGVFDYKNEKLRYMVMPKYETSLEAIREKNGGSLSESDTWNVVTAILNALEYLHYNKYVHADIKAANILLEKRTDMRTATLVDFGLARMASSNVDKPDKKRAHNGTAIFTSLDAHRGCHPSYRGDIEILAYNTIYWLSGKLPWQALEGTPDKVYVAKQAFISNVQELRKSVKFPSSVAVIQDLFTICQATEYTEPVDFYAIKKLCCALLKKLPTATSLKTAKNGTTEQSNTITPRKQRACTKVIAKREKSEEGATKEEEAGPVISLVNNRRRGARKRPSPEVDEESEKKDNLKENVTDEKKQKSKPISPNIKKNADKLRQNVPGLRNLPKGRRSILVNQITKKYQKIAAKKAVSCDGIGTMKQ